MLAGAAPRSNTAKHRRHSAPMPRQIRLRHFDSSSGLSCQPASQAAARQAGVRCQSRPSPPPGSLSRWWARACVLAAAAAAAGVGVRYLIAARKHSPPKLFQSVQMLFEITSGCGCVISTPAVQTATYRVAVGVQTAGIRWYTAATATQQLAVLTHREGPQARRQHRQLSAWPRLGLGHDWAMIGP
jgi:hypothetical protein